MNLSHIDDKIDDYRCPSLIINVFESYWNSVFLVLESEDETPQVKANKVPSKPVVNGSGIKPVTKKPETSELVYSVYFKYIVSISLRKLCQHAEMIQKIKGKNHFLIYSHLICIIVFIVSGRWIWEFRICENILIFQTFLLSLQIWTKKNSTFYTLLKC